MYYKYGLHRKCYRALSKIHIVVSVHARYLADFSKFLYGMGYALSASYPFSELVQASVSPWAPLHLCIMAMPEQGVATRDLSSQFLFAS